jgi:5-methyltetrahydrofolate--homocysteine methyltransferase
MVPCEKILETARREGVDVVGLSGLITPSLEEMVHVAKEMARERMELPLLIGGATTSKLHTAVKIAPAYPEPVVHVLDASRAVPVVGNLLNPESRPAFVQTIREEYERARSQHAGQAQALLELEVARQRAPRLRFDDLARPEFTGVRSLRSAASGATARCACDTVASPSDRGHDQVELSDLVPLIDWSPFFHAWELRGRYPAILNHEKHGEQARQLFADAQKLLDTIISKRLLEARGVYGFFPANRRGDDVELYLDDARTGVLARLHFLRQQAVKDNGVPNWCLADFVAEGRTERTAAVAADFLGAFAVTVGHGLPELVNRFRRDHDDYSAIMAEALADRLAEAFAEWLHRRVRREWGYGRNEQLTNEQLIDEQYRGIRPAPGYPACPDHTEKGTLWELLEVERQAGISLTESFAMSPGSSVSGWYFAHPEAKYFAVGKIGRDQVIDYAARKGSRV